MHKQLARFAKWLQPTLETSSEKKLTGYVVNLTRLLATIPIAAAALIWLTVVTDFSRLFPTQQIVLLLLALGFLLIAFPLWEPDESALALFDQVSFAPLIYFSTLFIWGSPAIWLIPTTAVLYLGWQLLARQQERFNYLYQMLNQIAGFGLAALAAQFTYLQLGGMIPSSGWRAAPPAALAAATAVWLITPFAYTALMRHLISGRRSVNSTWNWRNNNLIAFFIQLFMALFAIFAADLYRLNAGAYIIFLTGVFLISLLTNRVYARVMRHMQQERSLALVENLSRRVLEPDEEQRSLSVVLQGLMPQLFPGSVGEVRLFPEKIIYNNGAVRNDPLDAIWPQGASERGALGKGFLATNNGRSWNSFLVAIPDLESEEPIGAIGLSRPQQLGPICSWIPAAEQLAAQIAAIIQRSRLHQRALAEQAKAYRDEVISQAYEAEYYAQSLAYEKVNKELKIAGQIQSSFLPLGVPELPGWQVAVTLEPARQTSGDFYDFIPLPEGRLGFLVADVADKGIGPALYMALSRTLIRTYALEYDQQPHKALAAANRRILQDTNSDLFVTVFYAVLDPATGLLRYCNAGHNPPYLFTANAKQPHCPLTRTALPLGIFDEYPWEQGQVQIAPGDLLLLYTDGIVEAQDEEGDFFGESYLQQLGHHCRQKSATFTQEKIVDAVYDFTGAAEQADDITLMVLKRQAFSPPK